MDSHFHFQDSVANYLLQLFRAELHAAGRRYDGADATVPASPPEFLSEELEDDLIRAAIVLAQAWTYRGKSATLNK